MATVGVKGLQILAMMMITVTSYDQSVDGTDIGTCQWLLTRLYLSGVGGKECWQLPGEESSRAAADEGKGTVETNFEWSEKWRSGGRAKYVVVV